MNNYQMESVYKTAITGDEGITLENNNLDIDLRNEIKNMVREMVQLRVKISDLEKEVKDSNSTLNNHINFINNVYASIQRPLTYLMNKVNNVFLED